MYKDKLFLIYFLAIDLSYLFDFISFYTYACII